MSALDEYLRHLDLYGPEGVLEVATDLSGRDRARPLRHIARTQNGRREATVVLCEGPGRFVAFVPIRKGQKFHCAACRQRAKRVRQRASYRFRPST